jgi:hypothetical protein
MCPPGGCPGRTNRPVAGCGHHFTGRVGPIAKARLEQATPLESRAKSHSASGFGPGVRRKVESTPRSVRISR